MKSESDAKGGHEVRSTLHFFSIQFIILLELTTKCLGSSAG